MTPSSHQPPTIMLYDGWCSVCSKSATKLSKLDNNRNRLRAIDLRKDTELIEKHNLNANEIRRVMHAITPDGQVLTAMNALRHCLRVVRRGWMVGWTKLPIIRPITDRLYLIFADNRMRWFGTNRFGKHTCDTDACAVDPNASDEND